MLIEARWCVCRGCSCLEFSVLFRSLPLHIPQRSAVDIPEACLYSSASDGDAVYRTHLLLRYAAQVQLILTSNVTMLTISLLLSGAFINPLLGRYPQYRRMAIWCGAIMCCSSLLAASFASNVIILVVTQGCLYGLGGGE